MVIEESLEKPLNMARGGGPNLNQRKKEEGVLRTSNDLISTALWQPISRATERLDLVCFKENVKGWKI